MADSKNSIKVDKMIKSYTSYMEFLLKLVGCWSWYPNTMDISKSIVNSFYFIFVSSSLLTLPITLSVYLCTEWTDFMGNLSTLSESLVFIVALFIVFYFALYRVELYTLCNFMNKNFKRHSARGLTNMTMEECLKSARSFAYFYTACTLTSTTMYAVIPLFVHWWYQEPIQQHWFYMDVNDSPYIEIAFLRLLLGQTIVGLSIGQLSVFYATCLILICGQLDLLCCSLRNVRYTALLQNGVSYAALKAVYSDILEDERHNHCYGQPELEDSNYHFDEKVVQKFLGGKKGFDIYCESHDMATEKALRECAKFCQIITKSRDMFQKFVSPLLVLRVIQVTLYLCSLLYAASRKFEMMTVEYLMAVALDLYVYCFFGNQLIVQADRVSTAAYQCPWHTMGVRPRKVLLNILLSTRRPLVVKSGNFLAMDLSTYGLIIKTSFSYYTLLANVNEKGK